GLRKELGLSIDVDDDDQLTVLRPSLYPSPVKDQFSSRPLRLDSLACDDLPLCDGEHLFSSSGIQASCAWVTPEGCFRGAGGHAP
ncbi:unnamed protein product, partial [Sphacelaria rigidula]